MLYEFNSYAPFIFPDINRYSTFRKALNIVNKLQQYIEDHSRQYFSGFYDG